MDKKRKIRCDCGKYFAEQEIEMEGITAKALVCPGCKRMTFTKEQAIEYARLQEIHSLIDDERKVIRIGNSVGITLPEKLGLRPGKKVKLEAIDKKSFKVLF
ncbi:hypothetical protein ACFL96_04105 [Thermoproteota archaeon]